MLNALQSLLATWMPGEGANAAAHAGQELVLLPSGQFYCKSPIRKCLFQDAQLAIQGTGQPFLFELVASRVYADGEEDSEDQDEYSLLIDKSIRFRRLANAGGSDLGFCWQDPSMLGTVYEFHVDSRSINKHTVDFFETTVLECMFERHFQKSRSTATLADLELMRSDDPDKDWSALSTPATAKVLSTPRDPKQAVAQSPSKPTVIKSPSTSAAFMEPSLPPEDGENLGQTILSIVAKIYVYDRASTQFVLWQPDPASILLLQTGRHQYALVVRTAAGKRIVVQAISDDINPMFHASHHSFIWNYRDGHQDQIFSLSIVFDSDETEKRFQSVFGRCLYEVKHREDFQKLKEDDVAFVQGALNDIEMTDADDDDLLETSEEEEEEEPVDSYERVNAGAFGSPNKNVSQKNSQLAVGYRDDRSFVARGDRIGVFSHDEHDHLSYVGMVDGLKTQDGVSLTPAKMMLYNQDASLVMMDPRNENRLYRMDIEYGKVVDEWEVDENREVIDFTHDTKYGQMTPQQTFVGISHNALYRIDPRQSGKKLVESQLNQYKSKNQFSCTTTTGAGDLVVGSDKGDLRLYDQIDKRAKTHLPGLGDAILGVDVSEDGKFILATCKTYILVIDTVATSDQGAVSGFKKSMGAHKPAPKRLQLKPEHVSWMNIPIQFTPARFNTGPNDAEKVIVTSTGPYVITWNFRRVKNNHLYDYTIKKYPQKVVADNFRFGSDKAVVVALPDDVTMASKKDFMSPQKVFSTPGTPRSKAIRSRDTVVNSPY